MNSHLRTWPVGILAFFSQFFCIAYGQTWTPKYNTQMSTNSLGYYEYLPQGYNTGNETYPLLLFFHGAGEKGDGSTSQLSRVLRNGPPKQINEGTFPKSFTVKGNTYSFIVLAPQITNNGAYPADVQSILNYAISHYRIDTTRIYLTGLSMGGGIVWEYAGEYVSFGSRLSAIVPICGAAWPANYRIENIAAANIPVWATHNNGDPTVPVHYTTDFVNGINNQNPPPSPLARMTIFNSSSHDAWSATYDLNFKENGVNVYEWMLQYQKKSVLPVSDLQFSATAEKSNVALRWRTSVEINNYGYTIERSRDAAHFDSVSFVPAQGNMPNQYSFIDFSPLAGQNYYRLKIIATTGQITYSEVRSVLFGGTKTISLYPNPVNGVLHIQSGYKLENAVLMLTDMAGKTIMQQQVSGSGDHAFPIRIASGMYVASIVANGEIIFKKTFIKK